MELSRLEGELVAAAEKVGLSVRIEPLQRGRGGLCTLRGRRILLVDASSPIPDRIATLAAALATVDLEGVYLTPIVRATIGAYQRGKAPGPGVASARPLARARRRKEE